MIYQLIVAKCLENVFKQQTHVSMFVFQQVMLRMAVGLVQIQAALNLFCPLHPPRLEVHEGNHFPSAQGLGMRSFASPWHSYSRTGINTTEKLFSNKSLQDMIIHLSLAAYVRIISIGLAGST